MSEEEVQQEPEYVVVEYRPSARSEMIHFLVLVGVFAVVILVVAFSRPLIFDQVVPAVLSGPSAETDNPLIVEPAPDPNSGRGGLFSTTSAESVDHTVVEGEDLLQIARRYGVSAGAIMAANGLTDSAVEPGVVLVIPIEP